MNPGEFNLIFIDLIPGYAVPDDAGTLDAELAVIRPISQAVGKLTGRDGEPSQYASEAADLFIALWAMTHGNLSLEVNNHAPPSDPRARFDRIVTAAVHRRADLTPDIGEPRSDGSLMLRGSPIVGSAVVSPEVPQPAVRWLLPGTARLIASPARR